MYSPLAWVIIGGLLSSTFVARIVTPAIYKLIPPAIETPRVSAAPADLPRPPLPSAREGTEGAFFQRGMIEIWPSRSRIA